MKTFLLEIFPIIQSYSKKLDNLTLLTNQHWVSVDDILSTKTVYIFRSNNDLLVSTNGRVEKARWEYLENKSMLIDNKNGVYLFKHGFLDENILALKIDGSKEYAVFVNENKYDGELNTIDRVIAFLRWTYLGGSDISYLETATFRNLVDLGNSKSKVDINETIDKKHPPFYRPYSTDKEVIHVRLNSENSLPSINNKVYQNGSIVKNGKYKLDDMNYIIIKEGVIVDFTTS